jgi:hypothetical protein
MDPRDKPAGDGAEGAQARVEPALADALSRAPARDKRDQDQLIDIARFRSEEQRDNSQQQQAGRQRLD